MCPGFLQSGASSATSSGGSEWRHEVPYMCFHLGSIVCSLAGSVLITAKDNGMYESEEVEVVGSQSSPQYDVVLVIGDLVVGCSFVPRPGVGEVVVVSEGHGSCTGGRVKGGSIEHGVQLILCRAACWLLFCQCVLGASVLKWDNSANCEDFDVSHYHTAAGRHCSGRFCEDKVKGVILAE